MNRAIFAIIWIGIIALIFAGMWWGWRRRTRRDSGVLGALAAPVGAIVAEFSRVFYVSTVPVGDPLARVAAPGLRYRGLAEVTVREDGITVQVRGEDPVHLASDQLDGSGLASRRVGKAVERDGLALVRWRSEDRELESSFRFDDRDEQRRFTDAVDRISGHPSEVQEGKR